MWPCSSILSCSQLGLSTKGLKNAAHALYQEDQEEEESAFLFSLSMRGKVAPWIFLSTNDVNSKSLLQAPKTP